MDVCIDLKNPLADVFLLLLFLCPVSSVTGWDVIGPKVSQVYT
jgi:hypothetical protein